MSARGSFPYGPWLFVTFEARREIIVSCSERRADEVGSRFAESVASDELSVRGDSSDVRPFPSVAVLDARTDEHVVAEVVAIWHAAGSRRTLMLMSRDAQQTKLEGEPQHRGVPRKGCSSITMFLRRLPPCRPALRQDTDDLSCFEAPTSRGH